MSLKGASASVLGVVHSAPGFDLPAGACDCHVHVFGMHEQYPFVADRVYMPSPASVDDLCTMHAAIGIERVVIVQASPQGTDNRCLLEALETLRRRGKPARGVAVVDERASLRDLGRMADAGVRGLRVNLQSTGNDNVEAAASMLRAAARMAAPLGWHVQVYTNLAVLQALAGTIQSLPVPLVVDHFALASAAAGPAQAGLGSLLSLVRQGNVYVKLSAPYRIMSGRDPGKASELVRALIDAGPERMLWGTDWPHTGAWPGRARMRDQPEPFHPVDDGEQLRFFGTWTSAAEREAILAANPARLFGF